MKRAVLFFGLLVLLAGCGKETDFSLDAGASGGSDETGPEETPKSRAVLIEVQPDYFHDSTTSIIAYASDIYPVVVRDVYTEIPKECKMDGELVLSEEEPCRSTLRNRDIDFDIKSMTQSIAQAQYYLYNFKMKELEYWSVC